MTSYSTNGVSTPPTQEEERSLGEVVSDLSRHTQELVKGEIALLKAEAKRNAKYAGKAAGLGAGAAVFGVVTLIFVGHLLAQALDNVMNEALAYLIVAVLFGAAAAVMGLMARKTLREHQIAPTNSIESAKEDAQWVMKHK